MSKFTSFFIIILFVVGALVTLRAFNYTSQPQVQKNLVNFTKQVLSRRSKIPNVIVQATTARIIDVKTGKVIQAARVFSADDKTVYLSLALDHPHANTRIDYIRYLNGRYIDHGSIKIDKSDTQTVAFSWTINKLLGKRPEGKYKIATYTNGVLEKRVNYTVQTNNVTGFNIEEPFPFDKDYRLTTFLLSQAN